tara:strand:+ start:1350 stop:1586 length:237 start_codon:yes stop_codon:yes gene_type:complete
VALEADESMRVFNVRETLLPYDNGAPLYQVEGFFKCDPDEFDRNEARNILLSGKKCDLFMEKGSFAENGVKLTLYYKQ